MSTKTDAPAVPARERREHFETSSGIPLPNDFNPSNTDPVDYDRDLGDPGDFPYTRGVRRNMYRGRFWTMRQYAGYATAEESNARYKYLLSQGTTGLSVAFDLPTQIGLDSDDPLAAGEVGKVGVAIDSLEDMERLFDGIPLDEVSTSMTINATASTLLCLYLAVAQQAGRRGRQASGHDPERHPQGVHRARHVHLSARASLATDHRHLRLLRRRGAELEHDFDLAATTSARPARPPRRRSPSRSPTPSPTSRRRSTSGLKVDEFAPRLSFFFNAHNNLLEEIAKFRAARRLWARTHARALPRARPALADAPLPHADRRLDAHRAAARGQRRAHDHPGARRRARRHAESCTPTRWTRRWRSRPKRRRASRCARSRSSPTSRASPTRSIRSRAPTPSSS